MHQFALTYSYMGVMNSVDEDVPLEVSPEECAVLLPKQLRDITTTSKSNKQKSNERNFN